MMTFRRAVPCLAVGALAATCLLLAVAPSARAGELVDLAESCPEARLEQPFRPWLDPMEYTLIPGGTFESGAPGWGLWGAGVVAGNEPWYVHGPHESRSLDLPPGASARTPVVCAGLEEPTLRFFARASGDLDDTGECSSGLVVEVLFEDPSGTTRALPITVVAAIPGWHPTAPHPVVANLLALLPLERTPLAFRFTPYGEARWQIDDVYLDPYRRN
jgi:hypothetical protein